MQFNPLFAEIAVKEVRKFALAVHSNDEISVPCAEISRDEWYCEAIGSGDFEKHCVKVHSSYCITRSGTHHAFIEWYSNGCQYRFNVVYNALEGTANASCDVYRLVEVDEKHPMGKKAVCMAFIQGFSVLNIASCDDWIPFIRTVSEAH